MSMTNLLRIVSHVYLKISLWVMECKVIAFLPPLGGSFWMPAYLEYEECMERVP